MTNITLFTAKGIKKGSVNMPSEFKAEPNLNLLAQAIRVYEENLHTGISKTKTRGEVDISTRKIYRQKGTGSARHGAKSAPIFVGGGTAHGPKGHLRSLAFPKKMKSLAKKTAFSLKIKNQELVLVEGINTIKKTREAQLLINKIVAELKKNPKNSRFLVCLSDDKKETFRAFRNLKRTDVVFFNSLSSYSITFGGILVVDKDVINSKKIEETVTDKKEVKASSKKAENKKIVKPKEISESKVKNIKKGSKK